MIQIMHHKKKKTLLTGKQKKTQKWLFIYDHVLVRINITIVLIIYFLKPIKWLTNRKYKSISSVYTLVPYTF